MVEVFTPREHQKIAIAHMQNNLRCAIWIRMGRGKTSAVLQALENLSLTEDTYPVLIIAPLRVARDVWSDEVDKWAQFSRLKVVKILGQAPERKRALQIKADIYTINFENVPWLVQQISNNWPFKVIIIDEATKLRGFRLRQGAQRARALAEVAFQSKRFIELTGTPSPKGVESLWGQLWFLDKGARLGKSFTAFRNRWFTQSYDGFSYDPLPNAQKETGDLIKDLCLSIGDEYFPVDEPIRSVVKVKLSPSAQRQYKDMEKKMFADLGEHKIEAFNAAAKTMKCLQFANGAVYTDDKGSYIEVHDEKIEALKSCIEEANGAPVLVAYHFVADLERLRKAFPQGRVLDNKTQTLRDWNEGNIPVLFAHPQSAGHGLNLHLPCNTLVFFSVNWSLEEHEQIQERIGPARQKQAGLNRAVFIYYLIAENTIDEVVLDRLESKKSVQEALMSAMAKR